MRFATSLRVSSFALAIAACGARTALEEGLGRSVDAGVDEAADARARPDAFTPTDTGGCVLRADAPIDLTIDWPGNTMFAGSLVSSGDGALVSWTNVDEPSPDRVWRVQHLMPDGRPSGVPSAVRARPPTMAGYTYGAASLADGFGHRGIAAWDRVDGCRLQPLTDSGEADGPIGPLLSDAPWCGSLLPTPEGYAVFMGGVGTGLTHLVRLDAAGRALGEPARLIPEIPEAEAPLWWTFRRADDGSILAAWMPGRFHPSALMIQRFDGRGAPLAPPSALVRFDPADPRSRDGAASNLALAVVPGGLRIAWSVVRGLESDVFSVGTDLDGRITQPVARIAELRACGGCGLGLAHLRGALYLAWVEDLGEPVLGGPGHRRLVVATLDDDGALRSAPIEVVDDVPSVESPVLVTTSEGVLVGFNVWSATTVGVSVALIRCDR